MSACSSGGHHTPIRAGRTVVEHKTATLEALMTEVETLRTELDGLGGRHALLHRAETAEHRMATLTTALEWVEQEIRHAISLNYLPTFQDAQQWADQIKAMRTP